MALEIRTASSNSCLAEAGSVVRRVFAEGGIGRGARPGLLEGSRRALSAEAINAPHRLIARLRKELPIGEVVHLDS